MLTAAVIGCGPRGREHARALLAIEGIQLVGAAEIDPQRRAEAAGELRVPVYATADALLTQTQPNLVVLATPPAARMPVVDQIVRFTSVRALVVEKPMAASLAEANRLVDLCEAAGIRLVIGHQLRFCPEFTALKQAVDAGQLGRLESLQGFCFGNLLDQGPHLLDMICWLAGGQRAQWVMSQACGNRDLVARQAAGRVTCWSGDAHPAPAWMVHHIGFEGGLRATLESGPLHQRSDKFVDDWLQKRITAIGAQGMAEAQSAGFFKILTNGSSWKQVDGSLAGYQAATLALYEELRDVLAASGSHRNDWHDTLRSFELLAACAQSAVDGSLTTLPLDPERDAIAELSVARPESHRVARPESAKGVENESRPSLRSGRATHTETRQPEFSVIIPLPDHRGHALDCIASWTVGQEFARDRYEIILVGNGQEPELEAVAQERLGPHDRLIHVPTSNELEMYHRGAEIARGRWLLFSEPHCEAEPLCLAELAEYLGRTNCSGACLRSTGGNRRHWMSRLEERMFNDGFANWSRAGDWRKVIMRGIAVRRDVYEEVGGFEHQFDRFSEWALAATLHARGHALGYAAGAAVKHFDTTNFAELFPHVAHFTYGECAYRAARPTEYCERYFGHAPEYGERNKLRRDVARATIVAAWKSLWRDGRGHGGRSLRFAGAMIREMAVALPTVVFGPRLQVNRAKLALQWARLRLRWLSRGEDAKYKAFLNLWASMVSYARRDYLARIATVASANEAPATQFDIAGLSDDQVVGFYAREPWQGRTFRWMGPVGMVRLAVPRGEYRVRIETNGLLGAGVRTPVGICFNGRKIRPSAIERVDGCLEFQVQAAWFAPSARQTLVLTATPLSRRHVGALENRRLALPLRGITFMPIVAVKDPTKVLIERAAGQTRRHEVRDRAMPRPAIVQPQACRSVG